MTQLAPMLLANPVWHALHGPHRRLAIVEGGACRYPADVAPFAAIGAPHEPALEDLSTLLGPTESVWILAHGRWGASLEVVESLECLQMMLHGDTAPARPTHEVVALNAADAPEMVALTDAAFPGFFRPRTHLMGYYCGMRMDGRLVAMGGERLRLDGYPELSGICTHPAYRGRGFARSVIDHLVHRHRLQGVQSWLHVGVRNTQAIALYTSLGFDRIRTLTLHRIARTD